MERHCDFLCKYSTHHPVLQWELRSTDPFLKLHQKQLLKHGVGLLLRSSTKALEGIVIRMLVLSTLQRYLHTLLDTSSILQRARYSYVENMLSNLHGLIIRYSHILYDIRKLTVSPFVNMISTRTVRLSWET